MPENNPTLKSQYAKQVATDIEANAREQERLKSEAAALHDQLEALQQDHELLVSMQATLGAAPAKDTTAATTSAVPRARRANVVAGTGKRPKNGPKRKADAKAQPAGPSLRELVVALLAEHHEPRSAAEVTKELAQVHPERTVNVTLVRNALEASVAKNQSERTKQQKSVYYSALTGNPPAEQPAPSSG
ncbi:hypothetical protein OG735_02535 [Streptomyces sp. NBC_01210]|uniref:hypothetical protein n=1 Tax=Streptomyces sp. NBC_01210 TaxID=2903774 RepID=UPI002E1659FB|nr:hypothetical protein OG735_02535 [Streptomyces sp. NBC_01210]